MAETFNIHEAKTHLSRLLRMVEKGEEVIIARSGKPIAKLVPAVSRRVPEFGTAKGLFEVGPEFFAPLTEEELALFYDAPLMADPLPGWEE